MKNNLEWTDIFNTFVYDPILCIYQANLIYNWSDTISIILSADRETKTNSEPYQSPEYIRIYWGLKRILQKA